MVSKIIQNNRSTSVRSQGWTAVIPAAGRGSRLKFDRPKILYKIYNRPIGEWLCQLVVPFVERLVFVLSEKGAVEVAPYLSKWLINTEYSVVIQKEPLGMGDAISICEESIQTEQFFVVWGDQVSLTSRTLKECIDSFERQGCHLVLPVVEKESPYVYFDLSNNYEIRGVNETREAAPAIERGFSDCGLFLFDKLELFRLLGKQTMSNNSIGSSTGEFNLLPIFTQFESSKTSCVFIDNSEEALGVNTPEDAERAEVILRQRHG